jgi:hypothetical protein
MDRERGFDVPYCLTGLMHTSGQIYHILNGDKLPCEAYVNGICPVSEEAIRRIQSIKSYPPGISKVEYVSGIAYSAAEDSCVLKAPTDDKEVANKLGQNTT